MDTEQFSVISDLVEILLKQCIKNLKGVESIVNLLEALKNKDAYMSDQNITSKKDNDQLNTSPDQNEPNQTIVAQESSKLNTSFNEISQIDTSVDEHLALLNRRVALHKGLGSFITNQKQIEIEQTSTTELILVNKTKVANTEVEVKNSLITPLSKLTKVELATLSRRVFNEATHYITNILGIKKTDPEFTKQVFEESDRLLDVWMDINKKQR